MTKEDFFRIFAAVDPPPEILGEIERIKLRLKKTIHGPIRWVRQEGMHLTLKFFGQVAPKDIAAINERLAGLASQTKCLKLEVKKIGAFPNLNHPRVIWIGVYGDVLPLIGLQKAMDQGFALMGYKKEERPFRPHLTLGRVKEPKVLSGLAGIIDADEDYHAGQFEVRGLALFKSDLTPQGAIYSKLAQFPFNRELSTGQQRGTGLE